MALKAESSPIYQRIGFKGLFKVVWNATPLLLKPLALPYGLWVYKSFMIQASTMLQLQNLHGIMYHKSNIFRLLRPRFRKAAKVLQAYNLA